MNLKIYKIALLTLLIQVLFVFAMHAGVLKGRILDEDQMSIAYASITVKGDGNVTSSNSEGYYLLKLSAGSYTVVVSSIAYMPTSRIIKIGENDTLSLDFVLKPEALEMKEATVTTKFVDRGVTIMKQVVKNRATYANMVKTLESDIYLKGILKLRSMPDNILGVKITEEDKKTMNNDLGLDEEGQGIIYGLEQMTHYLYKAPNKTFNNVVSIRESGNPNGLGFSQMPPVINIYENNITILDGLNKRGFISPASSNAFMYYNFKYLGTMEDGDYKVHKISVKPKRKFEPLFSGNVYVVDSLWLFQSIELMLTRESQMDLLDTMVLEQYFRPVKDSLWMIQSQTLYPTIKMLGMDIAGNFITTYLNQQINEPIADDRFPKKMLSEYDSLSQSRTLQYWDTVRPVALEEEEIKSFKHQDSMHIVNMENVQSAPAKGKFGFSPIYSNKKGLRSFAVQNPLMHTGYNTVEGLYSAMVLTHNQQFGNKRNTRLFTKLNVRYGFSNNRVNPLLSMKYTNDVKGWSGGRPSTVWTLNIGSKVTQLNMDEPVNPFINTIYTLLLAENYSKLFENRMLSLQYANYAANGWTYALKAGYYQRVRLNNTTNYTFNKEMQYKLTSNDPANVDLIANEDAAIIGLNVSYQPGWKYIKYPKYKTVVASSAPVFSLAYEKGMPGIINSVSNYDKWELGIRHQLKLKLMGQLIYNIKGGGFLNDAHVNMPDRKHLNGNRTILAGNYLNTFQLATYYNYVNTAPLYGQMHLEWQLGGFISDKIPLFKRLNWHFLAGTNSFYVNKDSYYSEVFVGMNNIGFKMYRLLRVDAIFGYESGIAKPTFGIRIGLNLKANVSSDENGDSISIGL